MHHVSEARSRELKLLEWLYEGYIYERLEYFLDIGGDFYRQIPLWFLFCSPRLLSVTPEGDQ